MSGNGWCTHPDRQVSSDVRILVRKAELACRNAWGSDLWEDAKAETPAARPIQPEPINLPVPSAPVSYDDEVTSVVNADQHQAARHLDDEVVEQSTISFDDYGDDEQDERRELLYRDTGRSIERARERALQRRRQPLAPDDDVVIANNDTSDEVHAGSTEPPVFEPDDFIEEETPSARSHVGDNDDALLSEGIRTPSPRARRLRRFRDERNSLPKAENVTKVDPEADDVELEGPQSAAPERGRFDSIPEISADIDLPLLRRTSSATVPEEQSRQSVTPTDSSYERALKRAHALNTAARAEKNVEHRRASSPVAITVDRPEAPVSVASAGMPNLPEDDPYSGMESIRLPRRRERPVKPSPSRSQPVQEEPSSIPLEQHHDGQREPFPGLPDEEPRAQRPARQHLDQQQPMFQSRPGPIREERPSQEARRSWWRGSRQAEAASASVDLETVVIQSATNDYPEAPVMSEPDHDERPASYDADVSTMVELGPGAGEHVTFDLQREEDLESFRNRLFSAAPVQATATSQSHPQRSPISMSRRPNRADASATRGHRSLEIVPEQPVMEEVHGGPERFEPTQRDSRRDARPVQKQRDHQRRIEPQELLPQPEDAWYEPEEVHGFDVRELVKQDTELLDMTITISPDVPRACTTCRDYRPSEQPGRGWCTNTWAFTHRQMVNETDLACDSTIGCWWLPADEEVWLSDFEVAADATPRVERLIAHLDPERRAVGN